MSNTSEGIIVPQQENERESPLLCLETLPQISRQLFVNDIQKAIGNLEDPYLPFSLKSMLNKLLSACPLYVEEGDAKHFFSLCQQTIETSGKGWSRLSCWVSSEQNRCYAIFWHLKTALEEHLKQIEMFSDPQNDKDIVFYTASISTILR